MSWGWRPYVPVAQRQSDAKKKMDKLRKQGKKIEPVVIEGRTIAKKFWGKRWCDHLESFADYSNRLPRGRTYVRNGSVCHLDIREGSFEAIVSGSSLYDVVVKITTLPKEKWQAIKKRCAGHVGSLLAFLQGKVPDHVMEVVSDHKEGLFPHPKEIKCTCSCPDWAGICKHVAAVLYGVGNRLDSQPELLFLLRGVDPSELIDTHLKLDAETADGQIEEKELADIFGLDLEEDTATAAKPASLKAQVKAKAKVSKIVEVKKPKKIAKKKLAFVLDFACLTGSHIAKLRKGQGLSINEFAEKLLVSTATITRWEMNPNPLKLKTDSKDAIKSFVDGMSSKN